MSSNRLQWLGHLKMDSCPRRFHHYHNGLLRDDVRWSTANLALACPNSTIMIHAKEELEPFLIPNSTLPAAVKDCLLSQQVDGQDRWSLGFSTLARLVQHDLVPELYAFTHGSCPSILLWPGRESRGWCAHPSRCERLATDAWVKQGRILDRRSTLIWDWGTFDALRAVGGLLPAMCLAGMCLWIWCEWRRRFSYGPHFPHAHRRSDVRRGCSACCCGHYDMDVNAGTSKMSLLAI